MPHRKHFETLGEAAEFATDLKSQGVKVILIDVLADGCDVLYYTER